MRKSVLLILLLLIININILKSKEVAVEKIDLNLNYNELGVVFFSNKSFNSLILSLNNINILYIIDYDESLVKELRKINFKINFIVMNNNYDVSLNVPKKIVKSSLNLNNIIFNNGNYVSINYNDNTLCINNTNCDYVYYTTDNIKVNDNKILFYNENLHISDNIYNEWIDIYKVNKSVYTILKISNQYDVIEIIKNI